MTITQQTTPPAQSGVTDPKTTPPEQKPTALQVGEKTYTAEDVTNLVNQQASATQKTQDAAAILKAAEKFGMDPETFVEQSEGAFGVITDLIKAGVVDEQGKPIEQKTPTAPVAPGNQDFGNYGIDPVTGLPTKALPVAPPTEEALLKSVAKVIEDRIGPIAKALQSIDNTQTDMIRTQLDGEIRKEHPVLDREDISKVFAASLNDPKKSVWDHAKELSVKKAADIEAIRKAHAEEFGVDLSVFDANKLLESSPDGGVSAFAKGKKFSFSKKNKDAINPGKATDEFFRKRQM